MVGMRLFCFAMQRREARRRKIAATSAIAGPHPPAVRSPLRRPGAQLCPAAAPPTTDRSRRPLSDPRSTRLGSRQGHEPHDVLRSELFTQDPSKLIDTKGEQIFVEVPKP